MANTFLISDTHFQHTNVWKTFKLDDGVTPLRPFSSTEEMDEKMIANWNKVVSNSDKVYHLGDICMCNATKMRSIVHRLNGEKILIRGNHDVEKLSAYSDVFKDVRASHLLDNLLLTHIPVHAASLMRWRGNIHGHLHNYSVKRAAFIGKNETLMYSDQEDDPKYFCVSVERINYTPIPFETVNKVFKDRGF